MFSIKGDTVLDPFLGSGTTTLAAMQAERNSIGYEVDENLMTLIKTNVCSNVNDNSKISIVQRQL
jgi:DNA modification methylase